MNARSDANNSLIFDRVTISIFCNQVFGIYFWLIVKISYYWYNIDDIKHFYVIFICWDNNSNISLSCFDEIIFFKAKKVVTNHSFSQISLKVIFIDFNWVLVISPYISISTFYFENDASFSFFTSWYHFDSLRLLKSFAKMIDGLFNKLSQHFFVFAFDNSYIVFHFNNNSITTCKRSSNNLSFFSFS